MRKTSLSTEEASSVYSSSVQSDSDSDDDEDEDVADILEDLTVDQVLASPNWANELPEVTFKTLSDFDRALRTWERILQSHLVRYDYNTFGSYVQFFKQFKAQDELDLVDFVPAYQPPIDTESMSCVALSLYLTERLRTEDPLYGAMFSLVSCEEMIRVVNPDHEKRQELAYELESKNNVKEHVMVALRFCLEGSGRKGYVLLDPGYHVARPIVVMADAFYPHTGWFVPTTKGSILRESQHQLVTSGEGHQFIEWTVREIKKTTGELLTTYVSIIYVERAFTNYAACTEKRALIYAMKSYVIRNGRGPVAGFFSYIDKRNLILFYEHDDSRVSHKFTIDELDSKPDEIREVLGKIALHCDGSEDLGSLPVEQRIERFLQLLSDYKQSLYDEDFCPDLCEIDKWIEAD